MKTALTQNALNLPSRCFNNMLITHKPPIVLFPAYQIAASKINLKTSNADDNYFYHGHIAATRNRAVNSRLAKQLFALFGCFAILVPMISVDCATENDDDFNDWRFDAAAVSLLARATGAVERLDEQVRRSPVGRAWSERVLYREAAACQLAQGCLVHEEELVLCDAGLRREPGYPELMDTLEMLRIWRAALDSDPVDMLRRDRPGVAIDLGAIPYPPFRRPVKRLGGLVNRGAGDEGEIDTAKRDRWRRMLRQSEAVAPILAAALAIDGWRELVPEPGSAWRAGLLAALLLRARGVTGNMLLPVDIGWKPTDFRWMPQQPRLERVLGMVRVIEAAALQCQKDLATLALAAIPLKGALRRRRRQSRLPALARLFLSAPVVTVPLAARHLGCSPQAIEKMIPMLGAAIRQVTEGPRFRAWTVL